MKDGWGLATRLLRGTAVGCFVALVVTGIPLLWLYRPDDSQHQSWLDELKQDWLRDVHQVASRLFVLAVSGLLVVALIRRWTGPIRTTASQIGSSVFGLVVAVVESATGFLLAWDQLGLRAVTVGDSYQGALALGRSDVRFAIVNGAEVSPSTYLRMLAIHTLAIPVLALLTALLLRRSPEALEPNNETAATRMG